MSPRRSARLKRRATNPTKSTKSQIELRSPSSPRNKQTAIRPTSPPPRVETQPEAVGLPATHTPTQPAISSEQPPPTHNLRSKKPSHPANPSPTASPVDTPSPPPDHTHDLDTHPQPPSSAINRRPALTDENFPESKQPDPNVTPPSADPPPRLPFQSLQTTEPCSSRPVLTTYGRHRRGNVVEMPSSRALGMLRGKSPLQAGKSGEASRQGEEEEEEEEGSLQQEDDTELHAFMMQQKALWAEVDAVDLEEELD